jgi:hypothetical protein
MLLSLEETTKIIETGRRLVIAGDESLLSKLPKGNWIGGTSPYFMSEEGGVATREEVYVNDLTDCTLGAKIKTYPASELPRVAHDAYDHGFTVLIIPCFSDAHTEYAHNAPEYEQLFMNPIVGWISGVHLDDFRKVPPKVFNGQTGVGSDNDAIAMHFQIEDGKMATVHILNVFEQGSGDLLTFDEEGFVIVNCFVNGEKQNLSEYIKRTGLDTKLPLVADYCGAKVNVSYQGVRESDGAAMAYAPIFKGVKYKLAAPVPDYVAAFHSKLPHDASPVFACNCILNFVYSQLEGKTVENMYGPVTFGEIAYQLVNQTLVYLEVK